MRFDANTNRYLRPRGVTLLELLIVMAIMIMVTAAAIPIMIPAVQNRRMREASRVVSSYFSGARSRAIETGRPVGVMIERLNGQAYSIQLSYVEVPPPWAGDTTGATVTVATSIGGITATLQPSGNTFPNYIQVNDTLKIGARNQRYVITGPDTSPADGIVDSGSTAITATFSGVAPWTATPSLPQAFQIIRQPVRSSAAPMQMPEGTVIDLAASGYTIGNSYPFNSGTPANPIVLFNPVITFAPSGGVDYVTNNVPPFTLARAPGPIFLLLGRRELMADVSKSSTDENFFDPNTTQAHFASFWVGIGITTGQVTVAENFAPDATSYGVARAYAQQGQGLNGQ